MLLETSVHSIEYYMGFCGPLAFHSTVLFQKQSKQLVSTLQCVQLDSGAIGD